MFMLGITDAAAAQAHLAECRRIVAEPGRRDLTLVVDGTSAAELLQAPHAPAFAEVSLRCTAVLCCRLSPIQKAKVGADCRLPTAPSPFNTYLLKYTIGRV